MQGYGEVDEDVKVDEYVKVDKYAKVDEFLVSPLAMLSIARSQERESSLLTTYWSESTLSS